MTITVVFLKKVRPKSAISSMLARRFVSSRLLRIRGVSSSAALDHSYEIAHPKRRMIALRLCSSSETGEGRYR